MKIYALDIRLESTMLQRGYEHFPSRTPAQIDEIAQRVHAEFGDIVSAPTGAGGVHELWARPEFAAAYRTLCACANEDFQKQLMEAEFDRIFSMMSAQRLQPDQFLINAAELADIQKVMKS